MSAVRLALLAALALAPAARADSFTSSASSAASQSVGSLSDSVSHSSEASSGDKKTAAAGAYRVTAVAQLDAQRLRLRLEPAAGQADGFALTLPAALAEQQALVAGALLWVAPRAYGLAFAAADGGTPFFLAVDDRLRRELDSVKL